MSHKISALIGTNGSKSEVVKVGQPSETLAKFKALRGDGGGGFERLTILTPSRSQRFRKAAKPAADEKPSKK